jgi:hypothetical protein
MLASDSQYTGFKNRIINSQMQIDQRNAGASVTPTDGQYTIDRWKGFASQTSKYTVQQNAGSVTPPVGFVNYLGVTSSSAYSVGTNDYFAIVQLIEGYNTADLNWGTANAQTITISFWVRSSLTGTFGGALNNSGSARSYPFTYTISSANTWEQKSITITGDTSGTWLTTNGVGIQVNIGLGVGTTYSGTAGAWAAGNKVSATGAVSVVGTNGATFYITGVQLEKGSTATSFDYRPYGTELALCQRYYWKFSPLAGGRINNAYAESSTSCLGIIQFPVPMRTAPTALEQSGTASDYVVRGSGANNVCSSVPTFQNASVYGSGFAFTVSSGLTGNGAFQMRANADAGYLGWSAEL